MHAKDHLASAAVDASAVRILQPQRDLAEGLSAEEKSWWYFAMGHVYMVGWRHEPLSQEFLDFMRPHDD